MLAGSDRAADEALIVEVVTPVVRKTVRRRFASARKTTAEDFDDVCADAVSAVIVRLRRQREGGPEIAEIENYAAMVASNTADRFFASRCPQRARLRTRIRYVLTTDSRFVIEEGDGGVWMCRFRKKTSRIARRAGVTKLPDVVCDILAAADGPMELSDLTTAAAHSLGITDQTEAIEDHAETLRDRTVPFAHSAELKDWLVRLWGEVVQLPLMQRTALLLHLGEGTSLSAITDLGVATFAALAAMLGMAEGELAALWNRIPLSDLEIAERLKLERQQVINLRASARQRLGRRMLITGTGATPENLRHD